MGEQEEAGSYKKKKQLKGGRRGTRSTARAKKCWVLIRYRKHVINPLEAAVYLVGVVWTHISSDHVPYRQDWTQIQTSRPM